MVVIVMENGSSRLRGELTRWMLETKPGVYVGNMSAMVRNRLWQKICEEKPEIHTLMIYSASCEQGFRMEMHGDPRRRVVDMDGLQLIQFNNQETENPYS